MNKKSCSAWNNGGIRLVAGEILPLFLSYLQSGKTDQGKQYGDDPEADSDSAVGDSFFFVMMMQRSH